MIVGDNSNILKVRKEECVARSKAKCGNIEIWTKLVETKLMIQYKRGPNNEIECINYIILTDYFNWLLNYYWTPMMHI